MLETQGVALCKGGLSGSWGLNRVTGEERWSVRRQTQFSNGTAPGGLGMSPSATAAFNVPRCQRTELPTHLQERPRAAISWQCRSRDGLVLSWVPGPTFSFYRKRDPSTEKSNPMADRLSSLEIVYASHMHLIGMRLTPSWSLVLTLHFALKQASRRSLTHVSEQHVQEVCGEWHLLEVARCTDEVCLLCRDRATPSHSVNPARAGTVVNLPYLTTEKY